MRLVAQTAAADRNSLRVPVDPEDLRARLPRSAAAWPPSPRVASTTRRAPRAASSTGVEQHRQVVLRVGLGHAEL